MRSPKYSEVFWDCVLFLRNANTEARDNFFMEVKERLKIPDVCTVNDLRKASLAFSIDFSGDLLQLGDGYVYAYITNDGELFYIGCGQSNRVCNVHSRSKGFKAMHELGANAYVLASNVYKTKADEIETLLIWVAQMNGCMLENSDKILSNFELRCFLAKQKDREIKFNSDIEDKWFKYENLMLDYKEVADSLQHLLTICLDKKEFQKYVPKPKDAIPATQSSWTINGETKTIVEWCQQYGKTRSCVEKRIENLGLTPLQALTLPLVPNDKTRLDPIGYWCSLGLLPEEYTA